MVTILRKACFELETIPRLFQCSHISRRPSPLGYDGVGEHFFSSFLSSLPFLFPFSLDPLSPNPPCALVSSCRSSILLRISGGKITRDASDKVDVTAKTIAARGFVSRLIIELRIVAVKAIYRDTRRVSFTERLMVLIDKRHEHTGTR